MKIIVKKPKGPGRYDREGISLIELMETFPTEDSAREWFEQVLWCGDRFCSYCGSLDTKEVSHKSMPYRCNDCYKHFSAKTNTVMHGSRLGYRKWVFAIYLNLTSLKGVSSMKLHRDLGITQKTAWYMNHRIRAAFANQTFPFYFEGPVEVDETFIGGKEKNKHASKKTYPGGGIAGKAVVVGAKDRMTNDIKADVIPDVKGKTLKEFVEQAALEEAMIYTDEHAGYKMLDNPHESVKHHHGEYVSGDAHTQGIDSFWAMFKRGYHGTYHHMSHKHLHRYVKEFSGRHNLRDMDTKDQMILLARRMQGTKLPYEDLIGG